MSNLFYICYIIAICRISVHPPDIKCEGDLMEAEEDDKKPLCHICGKAFCNKANLKIHIRSHDENKPYPCEHCGL